ncbi:hypothetical protein AV530_003713 [Patagioenas fasciata monilis]|uniref:Uncharacterized protein n=1 Tax=Patagioenas fasciata monilis TaxID=372326 RepID=A0A1V4KYY7_PATFA|nr:hypothetical protein AV530_003713 [Patagioenas fasciata monilis]
MVDAGSPEGQCPGRGPGSSVEKKLWILEFYSGFYWFSGVLSIETAVAWCPGRVSAEGADVPAFQVS